MSGFGDLTPERAGDVRVVAKGGAVQMLGQITQKLVTFLLVAVMVRMLGTADYGLYRQVFQILMVATTLSSGGFPAAAVRFIVMARVAKDPNASRGAARTTIAGAAVASLVVFAVGFIAADDIAAAFADSPSNRSYLAFLLRVGAAYVPLYGCMQVLRFCTQAYRTMVPSVIVGNVIQPLSRFGLTVAALLAGFAVTGAVVALVASAGIALVGGFWYYRRLLSDQERVAVPRAKVGPILRFVLPQAGVALFSTQSLGLGILLIGVFGVDREVGLYGIAQSLQLAGGMFLNSIVGIWAPVVVHIYERGEIARLQSLYQTINRWVATFSVPIFMALMIQPELFVLLLSGRAESEAAILVSILAAGNLFYVATGPSGYLLAMTGRPSVNLVNSLVSVGLYVGLGIWLVPKYGAVGMAIVDAIVTALLNIARVIEGKILVGVQPFGRTFVKPMAATIAASGVLLIARLVLGHSVPMAIVGLLIAGLVYVGVLKVLGLEAEEKHVIDEVRTKFLGAFKRG
jgi:O-antigen/teichoic acid export membrane protein